MAKQNAKIAARKAHADSVRKSKAVKVTGLQVFTATLIEGAAQFDVLDLVRRMGVQAARDAYVCGKYVARLRKEGHRDYPASEPETVALSRAMGQVALGVKKVELDKAQALAKTSATVAYSRLTADLGVRADKRGAKRGAKGPRITGNTKAGTDAPKVDAPKVDAPKVDAPKVDAPPRTFADVCDSMLAMVRSIAALNKSSAKLPGMIAIAATVSKCTHDMEAVILAARKA